MKQLLIKLFHHLWKDTDLQKLSKEYRTFKYKKGNYILVSSWVFPTFYNILHRNFGDDINRPIIEVISGKKVSFLKEIKYNEEENLVAIGSVLGFGNNRNSLVWGSGFLSEEVPMQAPPLKVCAVRGPLTKKRLNDRGVLCPPIFGDPALLLPHIYMPKVKKKYKFGIIPHFTEYNLPHVVKFRNTHPDVKFIKMENYKSWKNVIDEINQCDYILSGSLHGLIVSDAYKIPNAYVNLSNSVKGGYFKFKDYMAGVGRTYINPIIMTDAIDMSSAMGILNSYQPINFDHRPLLNAFPYELSSKFKQML